MHALNDDVREGGSGSELGRTGAEGAERLVSDRKGPAPTGRAAPIRATRLRFGRGTTRRTGVIWAEERSRRPQRAEMAILGAEQGQLIRFDGLRRSKLERSKPFPSSQNGAKNRRTGAEGPILTGRPPAPVRARRNRPRRSGPAPARSAQARRSRLGCLRGLRRSWRASSLSAYPARAA